VVKDTDLIAKKLAFVETCVRELREVARIELIEDDVRERRFIEHTLQIAIQAALDVASYIVSDERLGEPRTNGELFEILARNGWVSQDLSPTLRKMAGFRNVLVHGYATVDPELLRTVAGRHLDDLESYVAAIRARL
jgi:uncharacterized protein YutE (UPF0331/DUF86 family)